MQHHRTPASSASLTFPRLLLKLGELFTTQADAELLELRNDCNEASRGAGTVTALSPEHSTVVMHILPNSAINIQSPRCEKCTVNCTEICACYCLGSTSPCFPVFFPSFQYKPAGPAAKPPLAPNPHRTRPGDATPGLASSLQQSHQNPGGKF